MSDGRGGQARAPAELLREIELLRAENARLRELLDTAADASDPRRLNRPEGSNRRTDPRRGGTAGLPRVDAKSSAMAKIALFRALFAGRDDVYAIRWDNSEPGRRAGARPWWAGHPTRSARTASISP